MAVIGTYNGASILAFPARPAPRQVELVMNDTVSISRSPYTGSTQVQAWPGADWWEASVSLPQMTQTDAAVWSAFLGECRGMTNVFYLSNPLYRKPAGLVRGQPVCAGTTPAMAQAVTTRGWPANAQRLLLPGDFLQLGQRLHRVLEAVSADTSGNATIQLWPSIRESTSDGQTVILNNPRGLFRLAENRRSVLSNETRLSGISLKCLEAR